MKIVVLPPLTPPLKASSLLLTRNGFCSGNATSTSVLPLPTIAVGQAFRAAWCPAPAVCPTVQTGRPLALIAPFLSVSTIDFLQRRRVGAVGGRDFAADVERDRRQFVLRQRLRAEAAVERSDQVARLDDVGGFSAVAIATPTATASSRPQGQCRNQTLAHVLYLSPLRPGRHSPGHRKPWCYPSRAQITSLCNLDKPRHSQKRAA